MARKQSYYRYKPESAMNGPHALTRDMVLRIVPKGHGVYFLSVKNVDGTAYLVCYVGRSRDLEQRLLEHVGTGYGYFYYLTTVDEESAYLKECAEYHRYDGPAMLDNEIHPDRPTRWSRACPVCGA